MLTNTGDATLRILQVLINYPNTIHQSFGLETQKAPSPQTQLLRVNSNDLLRASQTYSGSGFFATQIPQIIGVSSKTLIEFSVRMLIFIYSIK